MLSHGVLGARGLGSGLCQKHQRSQLLGERCHLLADCNLQSDTYSGVRSDKDSDQVASRILQVHVYCTASSWPQHAAQCRAVLPKQPEVASTGTPPASPTRSCRSSSTLPPSLSQWVGNLIELGKPAVGGLRGSYGCLESWWGGAAARV